MEEKTVSVKVKLSVEDYCEIQSQLLRKLLIALSVALPCLILGMAVLFENIDFSSPSSLLIYGGLMLFLVVFVWVYFPKRSKKMWIKQYESSKLIQKEQVYVINADGMEVSSDISTARLAWQDLHAFRETKNAFYVYISFKQLHYIPKKSFGGNEEDINFARECFSNLPAYPVTKGGKKPAKTSSAFYIILISFVVILVFTFIFFSR